MPCPVNGSASVTAIGRVGFSSGLAFSQRKLDLIFCVQENGVENPKMDWFCRPCCQEQVEKITDLVIKKAKKQTAPVQRNKYNQFSRQVQSFNRSEFRALLILSNFSLELVRLAWSEPHQVCRWGSNWDLELRMHR